MSGKHETKIVAKRIRRAFVAFILVLALGASSVITVVANSVTANVIDGENTYTFDMRSADTEDIIAVAREMGMAPLGPLDVCESVGNTTTVNVLRGVNVTVNELAAKQSFVSYKGETIEKALQQNGIILKDKDEVTPARDAVITADTEITIKRFCTVVVSADEKDTTVSLTGGNVADALKKANVKMGPDDALNYGKNDPLFDEMNIKVLRVMTVQITADGETKEYKVSAATVSEAIEKAGLKIGENDRVAPKLTAKLTDGELIVINRVVKKEATKTQEIPYETTTEKDSSIYTDESYVKTEGVVGEKEVKYSEIYVDGELEKSEVISETVKKKAINEVVVIGTKEYQNSNDSNDNSGSGSNSSGGSADGFSYSSVLQGTATAYCDSGYTATGAPCGWGNVAVNPDVIPYGTRLYIASPDGSYVYGYAIASDTGGALMSGAALVDLWMPSESDCNSFGRRTMNVYIRN